MGFPLGGSAGEVWMGVMDSFLAYLFPGPAPGVRNSVVCHRGESSLSGDPTWAVEFLVVVVGAQFEMGSPPFCF